MPMIYLVRHGRAVSGFAEELDPGLGDMGRTQSFMVLEAMKNVEPIDILTSPMRRCRETAEPLAKRWGVEPKVAEAVTEIPSGDMSAQERGNWLGDVMEGKWSDTNDEVKTWRQGVFDFLSGLDKDTIIFSHFIAINSVIGKAKGVDDVVCALLDNGSITKIQVDGDHFEIVELGKVTGKTKVR